MPDTPDEELVRRLLADSRHEEPMPADLVARLDGVLADLAGDGTPAAADRSPRAAGDEVDREQPATEIRRLPVRRPRRWATALLAAAAVVVGGVTLRAVWPGPTGSSDSSVSSEAGGRSSASDSGAGPGSKEASTRAVAELHRATLRSDVLRAVEELRAPLAELTPQPGMPIRPFSCADADWGPGTAHPARLDGSDAMLVLRPPAEGRQVAEVVECGTARRLASVTLPAR